LKLQTLERGRSIMNLKGTCPGSYGVPFKSTLDFVSPTISFPWGEGESHQHICSQREYINYSPEELRWGDYCRKKNLEADVNSHRPEQFHVEGENCQLPLEAFSRQEDPQPDVDSPAHEPFTLEDGEFLKKPVVCLPRPKPIVCLPSADAGVSSPAAVIKLQNELEKLKLRVSKLEEALNGEKISNEKLKQEVNEMKTLKKISEADERGGIEAKFDAELGEKIEVRLRDLSADETRQFIASNQTVKEIITGNIKSKVAKEVKTIKEQLGAEYAEKLKTLQNEADFAKGQPVVLEGENSELIAKSDPQRLWEAREMLVLVGKAVIKNPATHVGDVWKEVQQFNKLLADQQSCLNTTSTTAAETEVATSQPSMSQYPIKSSAETSAFDTCEAQQMPPADGLLRI
jgi:hypothetical protein